MEALKERIDACDEKSMTSLLPKERKTRNVFDKDDTNVAKGIAIIMLFIHHMYYSESTFSGFQIDFFPLTEHITLVLAALCRVCVGIFVFLSAYGMTVVYAKKCGGGVTLKDLYKDSFIRYVKYIASFAVIFVVMLAISIGIKSEHNFTSVFGSGLTSIPNFIADFLGISNIIGSPTFCETWWYNALYILILLILPLLYFAYKKAGIAVLFLEIFIVRLTGLIGHDFSDVSWVFTDIIRWLPCLILGVAFAQKDLFVKLHNFKQNSKLWYFLKIIIAVFLLAGACYLKMRWTTNPKLTDVIDACNAIIIIFLCYEILSAIKIVKKCLAFIGVHSMNLFLCHTFFKSYFFKKYMYSFENAWLNVLLLLAVTLLFSVVIEFVKKASRYNKLIENITNKIKEKC